VEEFEGRMSAKVRKQEKLDKMEEKDFRRGELPEKYIVKMLYGWDDGKFEKEYLRKLERNWQKWKSVSLKKKLQREGNVRVENSGLELFSLSFLFLFLSFSVILLFYF